MNIPSISRGAALGATPVPRATQSAQPKPVEAPVASQPSGLEMQNAIVQSALSTMQSLHARFEDKSPMPRPSPTADLIKHALQQYEKARESSDMGAGISVVG